MHILATLNLKREKETFVYCSNDVFRRMEHGKVFVVLILSMILHLLDEYYLICLSLKHFKRKIPQKETL